MLRGAGIIYQANAMKTEANLIEFSSGIFRSLRKTKTIFAR
jgi:hypothetical protein